MATSPRTMLGAAAPDAFPFGFDEVGRTLIVPFMADKSHDDGVRVARDVLAAELLRVETAIGNDIFTDSVKAIEQIKSANEQLLAACKLFLRLDRDNYQTGVTAYAAVKASILSAVAFAEGGAA